MTRDQYNIDIVMEMFYRISTRFASMELSTGGIGKSELLILESLVRSSDLKMSQIAGIMNINMSTATGIVDRLIEKGLVERSRNHDDRRVVRVRPTASGRKTGSAHQQQKEEVIRGMMAALSQDEQDIFVGLLKKMAPGMR